MLVKNQARGKVSDAARAVAAGKQRKGQGGGMGGFGIHLTVADKDGMAGADRLMGGAQRGGVRFAGGQCIAADDDGEMMDQVEMGQHGAGRARGLVGADGHGVMGCGKGIQHRRNAGIKRGQ